MPAPPTVPATPLSPAPPALLPPSSSVATLGDDGTTLHWLEDAGAKWSIRDHVQKDLATGLVKVTRRWEWRGDDVSPPVVLGVRMRIDHTPLRGAVIPGVLYHGNPSGCSSRESGWPGLVAAWTGVPGQRLRVEEHRAPAPFVSVEWEDPADGTASVDAVTQPLWQVAALHSLPSPVPFAARPDLWWSIGLEADDRGTELQLLSGPVSIDGRDGFIKSRLDSATLYPKAYLQVPRGGVIEKTFWLQQSPTAARGTGFQQALRSSLTLHGPYSADGLPSMRSIIDSKVAFARSRWDAASAHPGFAMFPNHPHFYVMGWAGQADAPGYALQVLAEPLGQPDLAVMARRSLDTLAASPFNDDGFLLAFDSATGKWSQQDPVSQGQAMTSFARAIRVGRANGANTAAWETFLRRACEIHAARFLARKWDLTDRPRSTAEAFLIQPLCLAAQLFGEARFLEAARRAGEHYWQRHGSMDEPYWGGTLDASGEDKEGAWAGFEGFLALHDSTPESDSAARQRWLDATIHAMEVCLTYTFLWNVDLPAGRLRDHDLHTRGWTAVSVQNMHLDVYGVLYAPELWRLGQLTGRPELQSLAELMYRSCGQMIDEAGSQGEQLQQTNYAQSGDLSNPDLFRGGYSESWSVFWIDAHFLTAAAKFQEMRAAASSCSTADSPNR